MQKARIFFILYRKFWLTTNATSLLIWALGDFPHFSSAKFVSFLTIFLWLRTFSQILIWYLFKRNNREGLVFYFHFGFSELQLALGTYILDLSLFFTWLSLFSIFSQLIR